MIIIITMYLLLEIYIYLLSLLQQYKRRILQAILH